MDKALNVVLVATCALVGFCIGGLCMCIAYGGGLSAESRPAPLWTILPPLGLAVIGGFVGYIKLMRSTN